MTIIRFASAGARRAWLRLVPVGNARRLARALVDARLQLIQGLGHHLPSRAPDDVTDAITAFLAATDEPARRSERRQHVTVRDGTNIL